MTKIYFALWGLIGVVALIIFAMGSMTMFAAVVFGFIAFGMTFMGMMGVLPTVVSHPSPKRVSESKPEKAPIGSGAAKKVSGAVASFLDAGAVDIRTPRHP